MTAMQIIFLVVAAVILGSAVFVVTSRNLIHCALWLIVTLFGVAVLYALLNAGFLAVVQVVIYIGAIAILFIFAVMLTRADLLQHTPQLNPAWWLNAILALALVRRIGLDVPGLDRLLEGRRRYPAGVRCREPVGQCPRFPRCIRAAVRGGVCIAVGCARGRGLRGL